MFLLQKYFPILTARGINTLPGMLLHTLNISLQVGLDNCLNFSKTEFGCYCCDQGCGQGWEPDCLDLNISSQLQNQLRPISCK